MEKFHMNEISTTYIDGQEQQGDFIEAGKDIKAKNLLDAIYQATENLGRIEDNGEKDRVSESYFTGAIVSKDGEGAIFYAEQNMSCFEAKQNNRGYFVPKNN